MRIWIIYVDEERYYATCNYADALSMYRQLVKGLGDDRVMMTTKKI